MSPCLFFQPLPSPSPHLHPRPTKKSFKTNKQNMHQPQQTLTVSTQSCLKWLRYTKSFCTGTMEENQVWNYFRTRHFSKGTPLPHVWHVSYSFFQHTEWFLSWALSFFGKSWRTGCRSNTICLLGKMIWFRTSINYWSWGLHERVNTHTHVHVHQATTCTFTVY